MSNKIYSFLGLATRAGKVLSGEETCERAIRSGKAYLVIVSEDASENTKKKFRDMCTYRKVQLRVFGQKEFLGRYTGKEIRAVVVITEEGFGKRLIELMNGTDLEHGGGQYGEV